MVKSTLGLGNHGDPYLKTSVVRIPVVNCLTLEDTDQFFILASNGVWEVFSEEEVILLLEDLIPDIDVRAILKRMQERASVLEAGLPVPKWDEIPRRNKGVVGTEGNSDTTVMYSFEQSAQEDFKPSDKDDSNSSEEHIKMDTNK